MSAAAPKDWAAVTGIGGNARGGVFHQGPKGVHAVDGDLGRRSRHADGGHNGSRAIEYRRPYAPTPDFILLVIDRIPQPSYLREFLFQRIDRHDRTVVVSFRS